MDELIQNINDMLQMPSSAIEFNSIVEEISKQPVLGSSNQCYKVMYMIAQHFNIRKMLEIGTHQAASTITFCQAIMDNGIVPEMHTVDNWCQSGILPEQSERFKITASTNIESAGFSDNVTMYDGDSITKVPEVFNIIGNVDLVFIDGNHALDYVIGDYNNCKPYSNMILLHDTGRDNGPESYKYLDLVEADGYTLYNFPTRYIEGDGHVVGITLAIKEKSDG